MSDRKIILTVMAVVLLGFAAVALIVSASNDDSAEDAAAAYIADVERRGVTVDDADRDALVDAGHELCRVVGDAEEAADESRLILIRADLRDYANQWPKISAAAAKTLC